MYSRVTTTRHRSSQWLRITALFVLLALGGVGCSLSGDEAAPPTADRWRRTSDGWQEAYWLNAAMPNRDAAFHPLCAALLQTMLVAMGLMANAPATANRPFG